VASALLLEASSMMFCAAGVLIVHNHQLRALHTVLETVQVYTKSCWQCTAAFTSESIHGRWHVKLRVSCCAWYSSSDLLSVWHR
jgi:hypothetical protein